MNQNNCSQCDTCAFTPDAEANLEPQNALRSLICVLGGIPFYCHHTTGFNWKTQSTLVTKAEFREKGFTVCGGWKKAVAEKAETGYYQINRVAKKAVARNALDCLADFINETHPDDRADALSELEKCITMLGNNAQEMNKILDDVIIEENKEDYAICGH